VRWHETVVISSLSDCLKHAHAPLLRAALPAIVLASTIVDGYSNAPEGPLYGGETPLKVLGLVLEHGMGLGFRV
jgi:hypothetical protein